MAFPVAPGYGNLPNGNFTPVIFSKNVLKRFRNVAVVPQITNTEYSGDIANEGDTVRIIKESPVTVGAYVRGQQVVTTDLLDEDTSLTVDKCNYFAFALDDIEKRQTHINWMSMQQDRAAYELRNAFDSDVLSYMAGQAGVTTDLGTTSVPVVVKNQPSSGQFSPLNILARIARRLDVNNIPVEGRWVVASPHFWELMQAEDSKLMAVNFTGDSKSQVRDGMFNGKVIEGKIRNFDCYQSNNLPSAGTGSDGNGSGNYSTILAGHISCTATVSQIADTEILRDPNTFADICRGKHLYGRKTLRTEALARSYWNVGA